MNLTETARVDGGYSGNLLAMLTFLLENKTSTSVVKNSMECWCQEEFLNSIFAFKEHKMHAF